jgi:hypothetical protein
LVTSALFDDEIDGGEYIRLPLVWDSPLTEQVIDSALFGEGTEDKETPVEVSCFGGFASSTLSVDIKGGIVSDDSGRCFNDFVFSLIVDFTD